MTSIMCAEDFAARYQRFVLDRLDKSEHTRKDLVEMIIRGFSCKLLETGYETWLNDALVSGDMQQLNNAIFQESRCNLVRRLGSSSGYDHCDGVWPVLDAFACGDYTALEKSFPRELGVTANGYPFYVCASNLLIAMWYGDNKLLEKAVPKAEKFISSKKPQWERAVVSYLYSLHKRDLTAMEQDLQTVCSSYAKMSISPAKKCLCVNAYGLFMLPKFIWTELNLRSFQLPINKNFNTDYATWRIANQSPKLDLYYNYPAPMEEINEILMTPVARTMIYQRYLNSDNQYISAADKKAWYLDADSMKEQFVKELLK